MTLSVSDVRLVHELVAGAIVGGERYARARRMVVDRLELDEGEDEFALAVTAAITRFAEQVRAAELAARLGITVEQFLAIPLPSVASLDEARARRRAAA